MASRILAGKVGQCQGEGREHVRQVMTLCNITGLAKRKDKHPFRWHLPIVDDLPPNLLQRAMPISMV